MWRKIGYLGVVIIWLTIMCFPILAFALAIKGEIKIGDRKRSGLRVFMVKEKEAQGIGFEWSRELDSQFECTNTSVRYLLWESDQSDPNVNYCLCYEQDGEDAQLIGDCEDIGRE